MWHSWLRASADDPTQTPQNHTIIHSPTAGAFDPITAFPFPRGGVLRWKLLCDRSCQHEAEATRKSSIFRASVFRAEILRISLQPSSQGPFKTRNSLLSRAFQTIILIFSEHVSYPYRLYERSCVLCIALFNYPTIVTNCQSSQGLNRGSAQAPLVTVQASALRTLTRSDCKHD
jgi:hypothetical protein